MSHRARWIIGSVVLAAAATYAFLGNPLDPFDNRRFSQKAWRDAGARFDRDARARMCRDIIKRVVRSGMPEKQVVALLGPPERIRDRHGPGGDPASRQTHIRIQYWQLDISEDGRCFSLRSH
jgi:hypothetical protein